MNRNRRASTRTDGELERMIRDGIRPGVSGDQPLYPVTPAIRQGTDRDGFCPPMPAGAMAAYAGLTDRDPLDIAHHIKSPPAVVDATARACPLPPPPAAAPSPGGGLS